MRLGLAGVSRGATIELAPESDELIPGLGIEPFTARPRWLGILLRADTLTRNSLLLVIDYFIIGAIGGVCAIVAAREWSPHDVGAVAAVAGVAGLLATASSTGLGSTITRFLGGEENQLGFVLETILIGTMGGATLSAILVFVPGHFGVPLSDLGVGEAVAFLFIGGSVAANNIVAVTDPAFLSRNEVLYAVGKDVSAALVRIGILVALIGEGPIGLFGASVLYNAVAAGLDLGLVAWRLPRGRGRDGVSPLRLRLLRKHGRFALGSHLAALAAVIPSALLVTIVAAFLGATRAAYVAIPISVVAYITVIPSMTSQALLAEIGETDGDVAGRAARALRLAYAGTVPAGILLIALAPYVLAIFGHGYAQHGVAFLRWATSASLISVFNYIGDVVLLGRQHVVAYNVVNVLGTVVVLACLLIGISHGFDWIGPAYLAGQVGYGVISATVLLRYGSLREARVALRLRS